MAELELVEFDAVDGVVQLGENAAYVLPYVSEGSRQGQYLEMATALVVTLITGLWILGVGPVGGVPPFMMALLIIGGLVTVSVAQLLRSS